MGTRVTVKGQVTIPKSVREAAGIKPGIPWSSPWMRQGACCSSARRLIGVAGSKRFWTASGAILQSRA